MEQDHLSGSWAYASRTLFRGAVLSLAIALLAGLLCVLYGFPRLNTLMAEGPFSFERLRPIHTLFAAAWIFLGGIAVVFHCMGTQGHVASPGDRLRLRVQVLAWAVAGVGVLVTLLLGFGSGREYMGAHPAWSIPIGLGWVAFTWNFFRVFGRGFWARPVYVTMWGTACLFFLVTFLEQHFWLLESVFNDPVVDRRIQWKATGTLVGSFNLLVYGALLYLGERLSDDKAYAQSRLAYGLLAVGLINSFTNYAHHTYHLPQSHLVKWVAFIVSMLEIILLFRVLQEIVDCLNGKYKTLPQPFRTLIVSVKWWTGAMLLGSILISIPPLNSLVHGTTVVAGHAMGTMIGIDSLALIAALCWFAVHSAARYQPSTLDLLNTYSFQRAVRWLNYSAGAMVIWLTLTGLVEGTSRYCRDPVAPFGAWRPAWLSLLYGPVFAVSGFFLFVGFFSITMALRRVAFSPFLGRGEEQ